MSYVMLWYRKGPANYVGSLMDYNARFYSPALGRFASADTIVPGAGSSQSYNRYMYVRGNPIGRVDPNGHADCRLAGSPAEVAACQTGSGLVDLVEALKVAAEFATHADPSPRSSGVALPSGSNVTGWVLDRMSDAFSSAEFAQIGVDWSAGHYARALHGWVAMVGAEAPWDYKPDLRESFRQGLLPNPDGRKQVGFAGRMTNFQAIANFTYGYYGAAVGMPLSLLVFGAGKAQKPPRAENGIIIGAGVSCGLTCKFGITLWISQDDPFDSWWIRVGFAAYARFGKDLSALSEEALGKFIDEYEWRDFPILEPLSDG